MKELKKSLPKESLQEKLLLPLDIQFFADGGTEDPTDPTPPADPPQPQGTEMSLDVVQKFLSENEDGKKYLQSYADSRVTDAIKTYEKSTLPKKLEAEIAKRYPPESEEAKQLRELREEFEAEKKANALEKLRNAALKSASDYSVAPDLVDFFVGDSEEKTVENMKLYKERFDAAVEKRVQEEVARRFKEAGDNPPPPQPTDAYQKRLEQAKAEAIRLGTPEARAAYVAIKKEHEKN